MFLVRFLGFENIFFIKNKLFLYVFAFVIFLEKSSNISVNDDSSISLQNKCLSRSSSYFWDNVSPFYKKKSDENLKYYLGRLKIISHSLNQAFCFVNQVFWFCPGNLLPSCIHFFSSQWKESTRKSHILKFSNRIRLLNPWKIHNHCKLDLALSYIW